MTVEHYAMYTVPLMTKWLTWFHRYSMKQKKNSFSSAFGSSKDWLEMGFDERVVVHGVVDADEHSI